jgi:hypothetical protein
MNALRPGSRTNLDPASVAYAMASIEGFEVEDTRDSDGKFTTKSRQNSDEAQGNSSSILQSSPTPGDKSDRAAIDALSADKRSSFGKMRKSAPRKVSIRLDLPSMSRGVAVIAIHEPGIGKVLGYDVGVRLKNVTFRSRENAAQKIRDGTAKSPIAAVEGTVLEVGNFSTPNGWTPVRYNPRVHSYFFTEDETPVIGGGEAMQIGARVFVKNPVFGDRSDFLFSSPTPAMDDLFGGLEAQITGPRAKEKANALAQAKAAPE